MQMSAGLWPLFESGEVFKICTHTGITDRRTQTTGRKTVGTTIAVRSAQNRSRWSYRFKTQKMQFRSLGGKIPWRRKWQPTPVFLGFPDSTAGKESTCNAGDPRSVPGLRRSPGEGNGYSLQYSGLQNSMDCTVRGVTKSWT